MQHLNMSVATALLCASLTGGVQATAADRDAPAPTLVELMADELQYSMQHLVNDDGTRPYYLAYTITDLRSHTIVARLGAIYDDDTSHRRMLDVDVRLGDYTLDNTHKIRGGDSGFARGFGGGSGAVSVEDSPHAIGHALWQATDRQFKAALERYQQVVTNLKTMVEEESKADDFSREEPSIYSEDDVVLDLDHQAWAQRIRTVSEMAMQYPLV